MQYPAVNWHQGMFLRPQHFQASDRHWEEFFATTQQLDHAYGYGVRRAEISAVAPGNNIFRVRSCEARLPDGTLVILRPGEGELTVDQDRLTRALANSSNGKVMVYLGVPRWKLGSRNVTPEGARAAIAPRFSEEKLSIPDDVEGGDAEPVALRRLSARLLLADDPDLESYERIPLARVQRMGQIAGVPTLDESFVPPLLAVDGSPVLSAIVRDVYDRLGAKMQELGRWSEQIGVNFHHAEGSFVTRLLKLGQINAAFAAMSVWTHAVGVHPLQVYVELCRIVGQLSLYDKCRIPLENERLSLKYDHENLGPAFVQLRNEIRRLLEDELPAFERRDFVGVVELGEIPKMRVSLEPEWLKDDWNWYIGVETSSQLKPEQLMHLLGKIRWKLGAESRVEWIFLNDAAGLHLTRLMHPPSPLPQSPPGGNGPVWHFFDVKRVPPWWSEVKNENTLAMCFAKQYIANREKLAGQRELAAKPSSQSPAVVKLNISLFAVRRTT